MYVILLAGGSGKRLWPLSNMVRAKQFFKAYKDKNGSQGTMVVHVFEQIRKSNPNSQILITTNTTKESMLKNILNEKVDYCVEPDQKDTFPAVSLALSYLHNVLNVGLSECIIVCPIDIDAPLEFFNMFEKLEKCVLAGADMALLGISPDYPSNQFAYVLPKDVKEKSKALWYHEKPTVLQAKKYIEQGALWSGGVYSFKLGYVLEKSQYVLGYKTYDDLCGMYKTLNKASFAREIAEKENNIEIVRYNGKWDDLGNWKSFSQSRVDDEYAIVDQTSKNTRVINELRIPIVCVGCENMVIAASAAGILVSDVEESVNIKPYVEKMSQQVMYAERTWGSFLMLDVQKNSLTVRVTLLKGHSLNYHSHRHRDEIWTIIKGNGVAIVDGGKIVVTVGDIVRLPRESKHTIYAESDLQIIEVQLGEIAFEDKEIFDYYMGNMRIGEQIWKKR